MKPPWPDNHRGHWWSGWPGAHCLRCGTEHALEIAMADGEVICDPELGTITWTSEAARLAVEAADGHCPADGLTEPNSFKEAEQF